MTDSKPFAIAVYYRRYGHCVGGYLAPLAVGLARNRTKDYSRQDSKILRNCYTNWARANNGFARYFVLVDRESDVGLVEMGQKRP